MPAMLCPACATRRARLTAPHCPVCGGDGTLPLNPTALEEFGAETVAHAVTISLEATARAVDHYSIDPDTRVEALAGCIVELTRRGLLSRGYTPHFPHARTPQQIALEVTGEPILPADQILPTASPYRYTEDERPYARGLPLLSADGHPSHLARVVDPADPLGPGTRHEVTARLHQEREAATIAHIITGGDPH